MSDTFIPYFSENIMLYLYVGIYVDIFSQTDFVQIKNCKSYCDMFPISINVSYNTKLLENQRHKTHFQCNSFEDIFTCGIMVVAKDYFTIIVFL